MKTAMALDLNSPTLAAEIRDLYAFGEMPSLGHVPARMHA